LTQTGIQHSSDNSPRIWCFSPNIICRRFRKGRKNDDEEEEFVDELYQLSVHVTLQLQTQIDPNDEAQTQPKMVDGTNCTLLDNYPNIRRFWNGRQREEAEHRNGIDGWTTTARGRKEGTREGGNDRKEGKKVEKDDCVRKRGN
jgi:hypothetical protein